MAAKKRWRKIIVFSGILIVLAGLTAWALLRKREVTVTVQTEKVARRDITELVVANGKIMPVLQVVINPEVSGEITELPVKEGQLVQKGDLLVRIKPDNYQAVRNSAEANFRSAQASKHLAQANLTKAELEFKRAEQLLTNNLVSDSQFLEAKTTLDVMQATYDTTCHQADQAQASLAKTDDDLSKTIIYAPMAGTVTKLRSQVGERVVGTAMMAGTEILTVADLQEMEARVDIGEVDVTLIALGQTAHLEVDAFRDRKFSGVVTEIANSAKTGATTGSSSTSQEATKFEVRIRVKEKEVLRPGMSVTAEIETRSRTNVLTVPIQSVTQRRPAKPGKEPPKVQTAASADSATNAPPPATSRTTSPTNASPSGALAKKAADPDKPADGVFVVVGEEAKWTPVKRGISDDVYVEITDGLKEGQEVVSGGYKAISRELEDGKKIFRGTPAPDLDKKS